MSDRAVQDDVIRALADAPYRSSAAWRGRGLADPARLERFARFLARHFYHERIVHFFKYSRALARVTRLWPEAVLHEPGFDALLPTAVLGDRATARAVSSLIVAYIGETEAIPYHADLLRYEEAMMVVEAGPRVWRETEGAARVSDGPPELVAGTALVSLDYDLPVVLPQLLQPWPSPHPPEPPRRPTQLLVARSRHGRVTVARPNDAIVSIVRLADGARSLEDLARAAGVLPAEIATTLRDLTEIGAVRFSTGS